MMEERDVVVFTDEEGNDFELEVMDYFFYNGEEYAVLTEVCEHEHEEGEECDCGEEGCGHSHDVYIMKVVQMDDDMEEFIPVEEELMEKLIEVVQQRFDEDMSDEDDEDEEEDEE